MRQWNSGTIRNCAVNPSLLHGAAAAPLCALLRMKRESSACVPLCRLFVNSGLIFQTQKDEALRRSRPLPCNHASRHLTIRQSRQVTSPLHLQLRAEPLGICAYGWVCCWALHHHSLVLQTISIPGVQTHTHSV